MAALNLPEGVSNLHMMMGGSHTRFAGIIIPTFEAAVPLLCLCADRGVPGDTADGRSNTMKADLLGDGMNSVTRDECMQAVHDALSRLQTLAEVSNLAEVGARTLARLISNVDSSPTPNPVYGDSTETIDSEMQVSETRGYDQMQEYANIGSLADFLSGTNSGVVHSNWEEMVHDLNSASGLGDIDSLEEGHS